MAPKDLPFVKKELKVTVLNPTNLPTIGYHKLSVLQGDLKTLSETNKAKLCKSILKHGYFIPAFVWRSGEDMFILDATQRYHALEELEKQGYAIPKIPYIEIEAKDKKDAAQKLLQITSRYGEVNPDTSFFTDFDIVLDYINEIEIPELEIKVDPLDSTDIIEDEVPDVPEEPITQVDDLWLCGKHRVLCGDSTKAEDVERLMDGKKADMVFTDPPYGIGRDKGFEGVEGFGGFGKPIARRQYRDEWDNERPNKDTFKLFFLNAKSVFVFGGNFFTDLLPVSNFWIVWDKLNTMPTFGDCELIWTNLDRNSVKKITFEYNGLIGKEKERFHPTQKPVGLYVEILKDYSKEKDIIADFFLGSGTTLIAADPLNRICYGMEIAPCYVDVILERYAKLTGLNPIRESDGKKWSELKNI